MSFQVVPVFSNTTVSIYHGIKLLHKKGCVYISKLSGAVRKDLKANPLLLRTWHLHYFVALLHIFSNLRFCGKYPLLTALLGVIFQVSFIQKQTNLQTDDWKKCIKSSILDLLACCKLNLFTFIRKVCTVMNSEMCFVQNTLKFMMPDLGAGFSLSCSLQRLQCLSKKCRSHSSATSATSVPRIVLQKTNKELEVLWLVRNSGGDFS